MAKEKTTPEAGPAPGLPRSYQVVGLEKSDFMPVVVAGRQIDLANAAPHEVEILFQHRDQLPWVIWNE